MIRNLLLTATLTVGGLLVCGSDSHAAPRGPQGPRFTPTPSCANSALKAVNQCVNFGRGKQCANAVNQAINRCVPASPPRRR